MKQQSFVIRGKAKAIKLQMQNLERSGLFR